MWYWFTDSHGVRLCVPDWLPIPIWDRIGRPITRLAYWIDSL